MVNGAGLTEFAGSAKVDALPAEVSGFCGKLIVPAPDCNVL